MSTAFKKFKMTSISIMLIALTGLIFSNGAQAKEKELVIGVSDALTGGGATYGMPQMNAIQLAVDDINSGGGVKVSNDTYKLKVIAYDDQANPTEATNSVRKLIDRDGVKYILGFCCSPSTSAVASFIGRENAVMLVGNAAERTITTRGLTNLFRTRPPADYSGTAAGTFVATKGVKRLGVIGALDIAFYALYLEAFEREFVKNRGSNYCKGDL